MSDYSTWITPDQAREAIRAGSGRGIKIAVIDSGIELSHPALRHARLVDDIAFEESKIGIVTRSPNWGIDKFGHGTAVATTIFRIAPGAQLGSFRVLDENLSSKYTIIKEAARLAIDRGYHILNCSIGSQANMENIKHFKPWIDLAYRHGVHVISACNNECFRDPEWPGNFPSVITVNMAKMSSDELLFRWDMPNEDFARHLVEFAARGVDIELPWKDGRVGTKSGSSFAAPHVAGLLARLLSEYPRLKPPVAKALLQEIAMPWEPEHRAPNG
jgi:subtilisin family serine protease